MKKRIFAAVLALLMLSLTACGSGTENPPDSSVPSETESAESQPESETTETSPVEKYLKRTRSDKEIAALHHADLADLQNDLYTLGDVIAYVDSFSPVFLTSLPNCNYTVDFVLKALKEGYAGTETYTLLAAWCLVDDYWDFSYVIGTATINEEPSVVTALCFRSRDGYLFMNPAEYSSSAAGASLAGVQECTSPEVTNMQLFLKATGGAILDQVERVSGELADEEHAMRNPSIGKLSLQYISAMDPEREALRTLREQGAEAVAAEINTIRDFVRFLKVNEFYFVNGDTQVFHDGLWWHANTLPEYSLREGNANCGGFANLAQYVLAGDYEEMGTIGLTFDDGNGHVVNYFLIDGWYYVMDFSNYVNSHMLDTYNLNLVKVSDLSELAGRCNDIMGNAGYTTVVLTADGGNLSAGLGDVKTVYLPDRVKDTVKILMETPERGYVVEFIPVPDEVQRQMDELLDPAMPYIDPDAFYGVETYDLPDALGGFTITYEEARALASGTLEEAAAGVRTVGDLILFLYAGNFTEGNGDCCLNWEQYQWHFNRNAETIFRIRRGGCGGYAALTRYLLDGDYEEVGILSFSMVEYGHVQCYVKIGDFYYFLDTSSWAQGYYRPAVVRNELYQAKSFDDHLNINLGGTLKSAIANIGMTDLPGAQELVEVWSEERGEYIWEWGNPSTPSAYKHLCVYEYGDITWNDIDPVIVEYMESMRNETGNAYRDIELIDGEIRLK